MSNVYVDVAAATIESAGEAAADPEAIRALRYLRDAGLRVVLVTADELDATPGLRAAADDAVPAVPARIPARSWYLTTDVKRCQGASARLRTVLIGAAPPSGSVRRCDAVARDIQAAAMEILAADAMTPGAS